MPDRASAFRVAIRRFPPFADAISRQWAAFEATHQTGLRLEAESLDLNPLVDALFTSGGLRNGDWDIAFTGSDVPGRWLLNHDVPEKAVAFDEARVRAWYAEAGLEIVEPVRWGEWIRPGGGESYDYQDTVIARRPG